MKVGDLVYRKKQDSFSNYEIIIGLIVQIEPAYTAGLFDVYHVLWPISGILNHYSTQFGLLEDGKEA